jgi:hypothetical protein
MTQAKSRSLASLLNKVCTGSLMLGSVDQAWLDADLLLIAVVLPWRETKAAMVEAPAGSPNKVQVFSNYRCNYSLYLPPLARGKSLGFNGGLPSKVRWLEARGVGKSTLVADTVLLTSSAHSGCTGGSWWTTSFGSGIDLPWSCSTKICYTLSTASDCWPTLRPTGGFFC